MYIRVFQASVEKKNSSWGGELKHEIHIFKSIFLIVLSGLCWSALESSAWFSFLIQFWSQKRFNTKQMKTDVTMTRSFIKAGDVYTTGSYYSARDTVSDCFRGFLHALISSWRKAVNSSAILTWTVFIFPLFPGASDGKTDVFVLVYFPHFPRFFFFFSPSAL